MDDKKIKKYRIGIDLGGTNIKAGLVNLEHQLLDKKSVKTHVGRPWKEIVKSMAALVEELLHTNHIGIGECLGIGIGSPGTIDTKTGVVRYSNNFGWEEIPLKEEFSHYFSIPISINNDANCSALGEAAAGAAKGYENVILLTLGTGVGGGILLNGHIFEGCAPGGAELGHLTLKSGGLTCTCGHRGCLEAYASATALIEQSEEAILKNPHSLMKQLRDKAGEMGGEIPFEAARRGDQTAKKVVETYIQYLGDGIIGIINVFRPEIVLISGGVSNAGNDLIKPLDQYVRSKTFGGSKLKTARVICSVLGNDAGIIGAANLI